MPLEPDRRAFLKRCVMTAASLCVSPTFNTRSITFALMADSVRVAAPRKVVVIGAGLAGLCAAYELERAGHDVVVLEAQERVGGRVLTMRNFGEGLYADAGAARIPNDHALTLGYVREFGLKLKPFYPSDGRFALIEGGKVSEVGWKKYRGRVAETVGVSLGDNRAWHMIEGGNDLLPRAFAAKLGRRVLYESPVVSIEQRTTKVFVRCSRRGEVETHEADAVICAVPAPVIGRIEFAPALSNAKRAALERLSIDFAARIFMQFRTRFWERERTHGFALTDQPAEVWPSTFGQQGERGILQSYIRHTASVEAMKLAPDKRVDDALTRLSRIYPAAREQFETGASKFWSEDEWTRCAWAHPTGLQAKEIAKPEGRLYFAGEHTSTLPSWMQGALESGLRAAREVSAAAITGAATHTAVLTS